MLFFSFGASFVLSLATFSLEAQFVVHVAELERMFFLTCTTPAMPSNARDFEFLTYPVQLHQYKCSACVRDIGYDQANINANLRMDSNSKIFSPN